MITHLVETDSLQFSDRLVFIHQAYKVGWPVYQIGLAKSYAIGSKKHLSRDKYKERRYTKDKYKEG